MSRRMPRRPLPRHLRPNLPDQTLADWPSASPSLVLEPERPNLNSREPLDRPSSLADLRPAPNISAIRSPKPWGSRNSFAKWSSINRNRSLAPPLHDLRDHESPLIRYIINWPYHPSTSIIVLRKSGNSLPDSLPSNTGPQERYGKKIITLQELNPFCSSLQKTFSSYMKLWIIHWLGRRRVLCEDRPPHSLWHDTVLQVLKDGRMPPGSWRALPPCP